jgi:predicted nucleotidyltransferase
MSIDELLKSDNIIFYSVVGSRLYGLELPTSDTDVKGVFNLPISDYLKLNAPIQIDDEKNDIVYYEVRRFLQLAQSANPNILELLYVPEDKIITKTRKYDLILNEKDKFLTKNIRYSLGGYAMGQIKKARGLNKKVLNPVSKEKKDILDFCYIFTALGTTSLKDWFKIQRGPAVRQENYGLSKANNVHNIYYLYFNNNKYNYKGLVGEHSNELRLSSIPKEAIANYNLIYCNHEGYSSYCKEYKEYWEWVEKRNPVRYDANQKHGKGYDGKNLMHCFRLLEMGIEACKEGKLILKRPNRDWLLKVRKGDFDYDYLIDLAEEKN